MNSTTSNLIRTIRRKERAKTDEEKQTKSIEKYIYDELDILKNYGTITKTYNFEDGSQHFDIR